MTTPIRPLEHLNENVVLDGIARDAKAGAVVLLQDGMAIYIDKLDSWEESLEMKRIIVRGILRKKKLAPDPETIHGAISAGMPGFAVVLENATWEAFESGSSTV